MQMAVAVLFTIAFIQFFIGSLILFNDPKGTLNRIFSLVCLSLGLWALNFGFAYLTEEPFWTLFFTKAITASLYIFPFAITYLALYFPKRKYEPTKLFWSYHTIGFLSLVAFSFFPEHISSARMENNELKFEFGTLYTVFCLYVIGNMFAAILILSFKFKKEVGYLRLQVFYLFLGLLVALSWGSVFTTVLPLAGYTQYNYFAPFSTIFIAGSLLYNIRANRLFDFKILMNKSLSVCLTIVAFSIGFILLYIPMKYFYGSEIVYTVSGIYTVFSFLLSRRVYCSFFFGTRKAFSFKYDFYLVKNEFQDRMDKAQSAKELFDTIIETLKLKVKFPDVKIFHLADPLKNGNYNSLTSNSRISLGEIKKANTLPLYLKSTDSIAIEDNTKIPEKVIAELKKLNARVAIPLTAGKILIGFVLVNNFKIRTSFTYEDYKVFEIVRQVSKKNLNRIYNTPIEHFNKKDNNMMMSFSI